MNLQELEEQFREYRLKIVRGGFCPPDGISISRDTAEACGLDPNRAHIVSGWFVTVRDEEDEE